MFPQQELVSVPLQDKPQGTPDPSGAPQLVWMRDQEHSASLRCDQPRGISGVVLGAHLLSEAGRRRRGRILVLCDSQVASGLQRFGFVREALLLDFYRGAGDCHFMSAYPDPERAHLHDPDTPVQMKQLRKGLARVEAPVLATRAREANDAPRIARLLAADEHSSVQFPEASELWAEEPGPSRAARVLEREGELLACAEANIDEELRVAEIGCSSASISATGTGALHRVVSDLVDELISRRCIGAYCFAPVLSPELNSTLARLEFDYCGTLPHARCTAKGYVDLNVWWRRLPARIVRHATRRRARPKMNGHT